MKADPQLTYKKPDIKISPRYFFGTAAEPGVAQLLLDAGLLFEYLTLYEITLVKIK